MRGDGDGVGVRGRRRGSRSRGAALLAAGVLGCSLATGCSPADQPVVAVARDEGAGVTFLFSRCSGHRVDSLYVFADVDGQPPQTWSVRGYRVPTRVDSVPLFAVPEGWSPEEASLTALAEGIPYVAHSGGSVGDRALNGQIAFTLADLQKLGPGDVLVADGMERNKVVGRADFLAEGEDCPGM